MLPMQPICRRLRNSNSTQKPHMDEPMTEAEVANAIESMKFSKAADPGDVPLDLFRHWRGCSHASLDGVQSEMLARKDSPHPVAANK